MPENPDTLRKHGKKKDAPRRKFDTGHPGVGFGIRRLAYGCRPYSVAASAWRKKTVAAWARVRSPVGSRRPVSV